MEFSLNGEKVLVNAAEASTMTLNEFIRFKTRFKGTKLSCAQGGCGACTVVVQTKEDGKVATKTVPSCLMPLTSASNASIITVEGLKKSACGTGCGGNPIQERMTAFHGTQCGFCTPGMVMQMWGGLKQNKADGGSNMTEKEMEDLDLMVGNLCRCTGYRPIADTLKSFAKDTTVMFPDVKKGPFDEKSSDPGYPAFLEDSKSQAESKHWSRPKSLGDMIAAWGADVKVISGHTGWGVYPDLCALRTLDSAPNVLQIDAVPELKKIERKGDRLIIGASVTLAMLAEALKENPGSVGLAVREHVLLIAGHQVRNLGSVGGNLMMVRNKGFASDLATILAAAGGMVTYMDSSKTEQTKGLLDFLSYDKKEKVLVLSVSIDLGAEQKGSCMISLRAAIRPRNAYSLINAAIKYKIEDGKISEAAILYGAVGPHPIPAVWLGKALVGVKVGNVEKTVLDNLESLKEVYDQMNDDHHKEYRTRVAQAFALRFGKALDGSPTKSLHAKFSRSTKTVQRWDKPKADLESLAPVFEPHPKTTALAQTTGDAKFTDDEHHPMGTIHAAYITIPTAASTFSGLDITKATEALGPDLVKVLQASDLKKPKIEWSKNVRYPSPKGHEDTEEFLNEYVFLPPGEKSLYGTQPVGLVLATSQRLAQIAVSLIELKDLKQVGEVFIEPAKAPQPAGYTPYVFTRGSGDKALKMFDQKISGHQEIKGSFRKTAQANFYIEPQSCLAIPDEEGGMELTLASQGAVYPRQVISQHLEIPMNKMVINIRRLGGGFGGKITRCIPFALVACLAAKELERPVRFVLPREVDMAIGSGRQEIDSTFKAMVQSKTGKIKSLVFDVDFAQGSHLDYGSVHLSFMSQTIDMVYHIPNAHITVRLKQTHDGPSTAVRAPSHLEAVMMIETVMDTIAGVLGMTPEKVREANFHPHCKLLATQGLKGGMLPDAKVEGNTLIPLWNKLIKDSKFIERKRKVDEFNAASTTLKRGISICPARYGMFRIGGHAARIDVLTDGTLQISTNAVEMGQGIHTKIGQVALGVLNKMLNVKIPLESVKFTKQNTHVLAHGNGTGGSTTSEQACFAVEEAAFQMVQKLKGTVKLAKKMSAEKGKVEVDWLDIVAAGFKGKTPLFVADLCTYGFFRPSIKDLMYETYGASVSEVEVDILTGETKTLFSHVMFDCAPCLNPAVDLGQIEGAYVMGMGQYLLERRNHCQKTGKLLSTNTWTYKPPTIADIPETFIVDIVDLRSKASHNGWGWVNGLLTRIVNGLGLMPTTKDGEPSFKSSKATGEPPVLFSYSVLGAVRHAITAGGRQSAADISMPIPCTPEEVTKLTWKGAASVKDLVEAKVDAKEKPAAYEPGKLSESLSLGEHLVDLFGYLIMYGWPVGIAAVVAYFLYTYMTN